MIDVFLLRTTDNPLSRRSGPIRTWPEFWPYTQMKQRCLNPKNHAYPYYGGRGIRVCDRWVKGADGQTGFKTFVADMGYRPGTQFTLDRIDNEGNYTPENCRWATPLVQSRNNRNCRLLTFDGKTQSVTEWAVELGLSRSTIYGRLDSGYGPAEALSKQRLPQRGSLDEVSKVKIAGLYRKGHTASQVARRFGVSQSSVYYYARKYRHIKN